MTRASASGHGQEDLFEDSYGRPPSRAERLVEREVFGVNAGITSYTTVEQADGLAEALSLTDGMRLLDVGAGGGWPGLYLAARSGCEALLLEVTGEGVYAAKRRIAEQRLSETCAAVQSTGTHLPVRPRSFEAVVHSDVL